MNRILVSQFKYPSNEGECIELGIAELEVETVELGVRLKRQSCAGPVIDCSKKSVDCVEIGGELYVVNPPHSWNESKADYEVNLSYQNTAIWSSKEITEVRIEEK